ncbi:MAG: membrane protein insertion efficiency factor YidD [bacterium]|nr:membrane protein insertion efficiency factor YidD [bacterium]
MTILSKTCLLAIGAYQRIVSPCLPDACRYTPSCSDYAAQSIRKHGALRGSMCAAKRVARCHPWHEGGHDPVK